MRVSSNNLSNNNISEPLTSNHQSVYGSTSSGQVIADFLVRELKTRDQIQ
jgi:hypothetical protein